MKQRLADLFLQLAGKLMGAEIINIDDNEEDEDLHYLINVAATIEDAYKNIPGFKSVNLHDDGYLIVYVTENDLARYFPPRLMDIDILVKLNGNIYE